MQVSKEIMEGFLKTQFDKARSSDKYIWTFSFNSDHEWLSDIFDTTLSFLKADDTLTESILQDTLVVSPLDGSPQLHIKGVASISKYCLSESPSLVPTEWYQRKLIESVVVPEALNMNVVSHIVEVNKIIDYKVPADWDSNAKNYRLIKEFLYEGPICSYKVTMVRESADPYTSMNESMVSSARVNYEFELLITERVIKNNILLDIFKHCVRMIQFLTGQMYPLAKKQQADIIDEYNKLIRQIVKTNDIRGKETRNGPFFFAPKPVSIEAINLIEPSAESYGVQSIYKNYAVTDKADGERMLLYIAKNRKAYLINNTLDVYDTGMEVKSDNLAETLLDGEYITANYRRDGSLQNMFAGFDIYFIKGKSIVDLPLFDERNTHLKEACNKSNWTASSAIDIRAKEHIFAEGDTMKDVCKAFLQNARNLPYDIDGLIFTPAKYSVFGYYPGKPAARITENMTWNRVMKWKPPEQNTIDFLVEEGDTRIDPITKKAYKEFKLYTGYNAIQWEPISVAEGIKLRYEKNYAMTKKQTVEIYKAKLFKPSVYGMQNGVSFAHIPIEKNGQCMAEDGSIIESKTIVEFSFDIADPAQNISRKWKAHRVRTDKTRIYQKTGKLSKTANDLSVALTIWRSIHNPVSRDMISGNVPVLQSVLPDTLEERLLGADDIYYARTIPREHRLSVNMLNFHNHAIKKSLYARGNKKALLELACGMAGDLFRWRNSGYHFILGVDFVKDNITNATEGAYSIMLKQSKEVTQVIDGVENVIYPDTIFAVGDCSLPIATGKAAEGLDDDSKHVLRSLFKTAQAGRYNRGWEQKRGELLPPQLIGKAASGFTVVSCMFAIHYFFKTEQMLNGFLRNVSDNLQKNGIFIATFMDGAKVHEMIAEKGVVDGRKLAANVPVWAIIKRYDIFEESNYYGKVVDVFIENTNRLIPEYLVNFDLLRSKALEFNLELKETAMFSEDFARLRAQVPSDPTKRSKFDNDLILLENDPVQTQFSFLNRWVVFTKK
jgi:hypothetical protein